MLTPRYLAECSDELVRLLGELDESIMRDFVRRLVKAGHITDAAKWQAQQMMEAGALYDDIVKEAARLTGRTETAVRELFREAGLKSVAYDINICRAAGLSPLPLAASPAAMQVLLSGMEKTKGMLDNLTMTTASGAQHAFIEAATLAEIQVESGAFDYVTAIRNAVRTAASGGAWVLYPTGARSRLDTATRRAVLTGVNQTAAALTLAYADDMGCDLVETTAHMGARPEHAVWQGQVFSRSGKSRRYPDFVTATGYGTGPGLCGWNCRHSFYMFFEGLDERAYSRAQLDEYANARVRVNGKEMPYYEATQRQRAMERRVRDTRRELAGLDGGIKAAPDEAVKNALQQDFDSAAARLKRQEAALKDLARQAGFALDTSRVQVQGFGRSTSAKAVWAAKTQQRLNIINEELQQLRQNGIIKSKGRVILPPSAPEVLIFQREHVFQRIMERNITVEDADKIIAHARFALRQQNGALHVYYSDEGFVAVHKDGTVYTLGWLNEGGEKLLEVVKKHGF